MSTSVDKTLAYYLLQSYLLKRKSITPPPLMFSWGIYEFFRSSRWRCFMKKALLKNFSIFIGKLQVCNFIKKRLQHRQFPLNIGKFLKTPILKNIYLRLLLISLNSYRTAMNSCFWIDSFTKFR